MICSDNEHLSWTIMNIPNSQNTSDLDPFIYCHVGCTKMTYITFDNIEHVLDMWIVLIDTQISSKMSHVPHSFIEWGHVSQGRENSLKTLCILLSHKGLYIPTLRAMLNHHLFTHYYLKDFLLHSVGPRNTRVHRTLEIQQSRH